MRFALFYSWPHPFTLLGDGWGCGGGKKGKKEEASLFLLPRRIVLPYQKRLVLREEEG